MKYHWSKRQLVSTDKPPKKRCIEYLFDEMGTLAGRIRDTAAGRWEGYAGRPGVLVESFDSSVEAKRAAVNEIKIQGGN